MSYVITGVVCIVVGFGGGVFVAVKYLSTWMAKVEEAYNEAEENVTSWIQRAFLWIKGVL